MAEVFIRRIVPEKKVSRTMTVEFLPHSLSTSHSCNGGKAQAALESYDKWTAKYKGLCGGGCGISRIVEVPMDQI